MSSKRKLNRLGWGFLLGGIVILVVTIGGYQLSRNPDALRDLFRKGPVGPDFSALETGLVAPKSCKSVPASALLGLCEKMDQVPLPVWQEGLSHQEKSCIADAFKDFRDVQLRYHRESEADYSDADRNDAVIGFACEVVDVLSGEGQSLDMSAGMYPNLNRFYTAWKEQMTPE